MLALESLGEVIATDILIIGGGFAGLATAIAAKEASPEASVLIVEKATTGWAGKVPKGSGVLAMLTPKDSLERFLAYYVTRIGCYLNDQELLAQLMVSSVATIEHLASWGVPQYRNADGSLKYIKHRGPAIPWGLAAIDVDVCLHLRKKALKLGAKCIDKVAIVDLLQDDGQVVGAIGFDVVSGTCHIVKAKATILANGSQNYRVLPMWSAARGDGITAAYRAGAEMRNAEFGSFVNMVYTANKMVGSRAEDHMFNARGENVSQKYLPDPEAESDISALAAVAWYKETVAGNGPLLMNLGSLELEKYKPGTLWSQQAVTRPVHGTFVRRLEQKGKSVLDSSATMLEVEPGFLGEGSPVKVDHQAATSLPGLFAAGDVCWNGSAWAGAVPPRGRMSGSGIMFALFSALRAGPSAASYASSRATGKVDYAQATSLKERIFAPLRRDDGVAAIDLVHAVQEAMVPVRYSNYKREDRMHEALGRVLEVKERLPQLKARDTHDLASCHEAESMTLCAEMFYRASLERKESRGWHIREDYPEMDNAHWTKWIVLKDRNGEMALSSETIPLENYPVRP